MSVTLHSAVLRGLVRVIRNCFALGYVKYLLNRISKACCILSRSLPAVAHEYGKPEFKFCLRAGEFISLAKTVTPNCVLIRITIETQMNK